LAIRSEAILRKLLFGLFLSLASSSPALILRRASESL